MLLCNLIYIIYIIINKFIIKGKYIFNKKNKRCIYCRLQKLQVTNCNKKYYNCGSKNLHKFSLLPFNTFIGLLLFSPSPILAEVYSNPIMEAISLKAVMPRYVYYCSYCMILYHYFFHVRKAIIYFLNKSSKQKIYLC